MSRRIGDRNPPIECRARDREILKPAFDEADDLVAALRRSDEIRPIVIEPEELLLIGRQPEKIALLLHPFDRRSGFFGEFSTLPVFQFVLPVKGFCAYHILA